MNFPLQADPDQSKGTFSGRRYPTNYVNAIDTILVRILIQMLIDSFFKPTATIHGFVSLTSCPENSFDIDVVIYQFTCGGGADCKVDKSFELVNLIDNLDRGFFANRSGLWNNGKLNIQIPRNTIQPSR